MNWFLELLFGNDTWGGGVPHAVFVLALVIGVGVLLARVRIGGISFGVTWILFVGIVASYFGMRLDPHILDFVREFGLILFIYSVGLQVGPGFFSSFKKGGLTLNLLAVAIIVLGCATAYVIALSADLPITTAVGILAGAVANTPMLGAAQQAYTDMSGFTDPSIAASYAVTYPLGMAGVIVVLVFLKKILGVRFENEEREIIEAQKKDNQSAPRVLSLELGNQLLVGKNLQEVSALLHCDVVFSRVLHPGGSPQTAVSTTVLQEGDCLLMVVPEKNVEAVVSFVGPEVEMEWEPLNAELVSRRILITKPELQGRSIAQLRLRSTFGVNITRVNRAGVDLTANPLLQLQVGDSVTVVGASQAVKDVEKVLGNSLKRLDVPNLIPIFVGMALGVVLGSIPFFIPGIPQAVKLGLAGGPLLVAILVSRFGPRYKIVTYTTASANLMLREIGIALFLACVGLGAGEGFLDLLLGGGYVWIGYGVIVTVVPLLIVGIVARLTFKINYFTIMGLLSGAATNPPALAYANESAGNDVPSVGYTTVYPLTMFLRVLSAQLMILFFS